MGEEYTVWFPLQYQTMSLLGNAVKRGILRITQALITTYIIHHSHGNNFVLPRI